MTYLNEYLPTDTAPVAPAMRTLLAVQQSHYPCLRLNALPVLSFIEKNSHEYFNRPGLI